LKNGKKAKRRNPGTESHHSVAARRDIAESRSRYYPQGNAPLIIGICGGSGSGKTTSTRRIIEALSSSNVIVLQQDSDYKDFPDPPFDLRFIGRLVRDISERGRTMEMVVGQYMATVRPKHMEIVEPSKRYADIIIAEGGYSEVGIDLVIQMIKSLAPRGLATRMSAPK
jgi:uridine kinase